MKPDEKFEAIVLPEGFDSLPQPIQDFIKQILTKLERLAELEAENAELKIRLSLNSSNSGKPPSSDGLHKKNTITSLREKSGRKPGGQPGHKGRTLEQVDNPDNIIFHAPNECTHCGFDLQDIEANICEEKRQVFEIPAPAFIVDEHRISRKFCPDCKKSSTGKFPDTVTAPVQYGPRVLASATHLQVQHFLPLERTCSLFKDLYNLPIAPATIIKAQRVLSEKLAPFMADLKTYLLQSSTLHFDESGFRVEKLLYWLHVVSNEKLTLYQMNKKRGKEALDANGILPNFTGNAVHDCWPAYFQYLESEHAICNQHIMRELKLAFEDAKENWASKIKTLLSVTHSRTKELIMQDPYSHGLPSDELHKLDKAYDAIIQKAERYHAKLAPLPRPNRGKTKQRKSKNLLDRLKQHKKSVLLFASNFDVPFTNNQAEQDVRMMKVKQKTSGCFRTLAGAEIFCIIRSYTSTARKNGASIFDTLLKAFSSSSQISMGFT